LGTHLLVELAGCRFDELDHLEMIKEFMVSAAEKAQATVLNVSFHKFSPQGVSGVVVLAESHISIHTWPESGYAAVDVFTCGDRAMPRRAAEHLIESLHPSHFDIREIFRGIPESSYAPMTKKKFGLMRECAG
jgi:S-adenosylmethionine decarboxylase